jgi:phosphatidylserine/phosphatidylglycerophosphate/cardiolipin synthase-like enzyme
MQVEFIKDREIYDKVILEAIPRASRFVWLATANIKDLHVNKGRRMVPFLETLSTLLDDGIQIRLLHAGEPGPRFREDFDKYPALIKGLERMLCPRCHLKCVIVDGNWAYVGSANLTGAGMGAKGLHTRNFESGVTSSDPQFVREVMEHYDSIWMGSRCDDCKRKEYCPDYRDPQD